MVGLDYRNTIKNNWFYWFVRMPFGSVEGVRRMSLLKAVIAAWIWCVACSFLMTKGAEISNDMQLLTTAIVVAGALAGGDK